MDDEEEKCNDDEHGTFVEVMDELDDLEKEKRTETTTAIVNGYPANYKPEDLEVKIRLIKKTTVMRWYANSICYDWLCKYFFFLELL